MDSSVKSKFYRKIEIWKQCDHDNMVRFICFEILNEKRFCVQSSDYFYLPIDNDQIANSNKQQVELFMDAAPEERSELYDSLVDAITAHELEFNPESDP